MRRFNPKQVFIGSVCAWLVCLYAVQAAFAQPIRATSDDDSRHARYTKQDRDQDRDRNRHRDRDRDQGRRHHYSPTFRYHSYRDWPDFRSYTVYRIRRYSPYTYRCYRAIPWYGTYYYPAYRYSPYCIYYAPGFSWGVRLEASDDLMGEIDDEVYFGFGYGSGIQLGTLPCVYSWYPYGGYQRLRLSDKEPDAYTRYGVPDAIYEVE